MHTYTYNDMHTYIYGALDCRELAGQAVVTPRGSCDMLTYIYKHTYIFLHSYIVYSPTPQNSMHDFCCCTDTNTLNAHTFNTCSRLVLAGAGKFQRTAGVTHIFHTCIHVHMCVVPSVAVTQKHSTTIYLHTFVEIHFP